MTWLNEKNLNLDLLMSSSLTRWQYSGRQKCPHKLCATLPKCAEQVAPLSAVSHFLLEMVTLLWLLTPSLFFDAVSRSKPWFSDLSRYKTLARQPFWSSFYAIDRLLSTPFSLDLWPSFEVAHHHLKWSPKWAASHRLVSLSNSSRSRLRSHITRLKEEFRQTRASRKELVSTLRVLARIVVEETSTITTTAVFITTIVTHNTMEEQEWRFTTTTTWTVVEDTKIRIDTLCRFDTTTMLLRM